MTRNFDYDDNDDDDDDVGKGLSVALRLFKRPAGCLSASLFKER